MLLFIDARRRYCILSVAPILTKTFFSIIFVIPMNYLRNIKKFDTVHSGSCGIFSNLELSNDFQQFRCSSLLKNTFHVSDRRQLFFLLILFTSYTTIREIKKVEIKGEIKDWYFHGDSNLSLFFGSRGPFISIEAYLVVSA